MLALRARPPTSIGSTSSLSSSEGPAPAAPTEERLSHDVLKEVQAAKAALRNSFRTQMRHLEAIEAALPGGNANLPPGRAEVAPLAPSQPLGAPSSATPSLEPAQVTHTNVLDLDHLHAVPEAVIRALVYRYFNTPQGLAATLEALEQAVDTKLDAGTLHDIFHKFAGEAKYAGAARLAARLVRMDREVAELTTEARLTTEAMAELLALVEEAKQAMRTRGLLVDP